ncbi:IQ domain-containing protein K [Cyanocitta cristata]
MAAGGTRGGTGRAGRSPGPALSPPGGVPAVPPRALGARQAAPRRCPAGPALLSAAAGRGAGLCPPQREPTGPRALLLVGVLLLLLSELPWQRGSASGLPGRAAAAALWGYPGAELGSAVAERTGESVIAGTCGFGSERSGLWNLFSFLISKHEAEQPQFSDVLQSKQDPESKQGSVPLEAEMLHPLHMEQPFSAPAAQNLLSIFKEAPSGEPPDPKKCSPREFLEFYIFPVLLPGLAALLHEAEKEKCFEGKRNKFIASDFLTEWLYNKNPKKKDESFTELFSIPFVKDWLKDHPRPPIPLSLLISEEEASILIQSFWRGYRVRCDSEIQELRQWQKKLREERHINKIVKEFWTKQEAKVGSKSEELDKRTRNPSTSQF